MRCSCSTALLLLLLLLLLLPLCGLAPTWIGLGCREALPL